MGPIKNRIFIDDRSKIVDEKVRIGDREIDTLVGKQHQKSIVTLVERVTKKTLIGCIIPKPAELVANQMLAFLQPLKEYVFTITADNGYEFAYYEITSAALEAKTFFAHPYHSWARGLNENTNNLIRQYILKDSNLKNIDENSIRFISDRLNNRPRKSLGYAIPNEAFEEKIRNNKLVSTQTSLLLG